MQLDKGAPRIRLHTLILSVRFSLWSWPNSGFRWGHVCKQKTTKKKPRTLTMLCVHIICC